MPNPKMNLILEGLHKDYSKQILKTEGTTSSNISTPSGKLTSSEKKTYTCPECGSTDVLITDEGKFHCTSCEHDWTVEEESRRTSTDNEKSKRKSIKV